MGEDESLALYPLGPSFMPVTAAADWNSTGHSGMVETTKGVAGGTQTFADEEAEAAPSSYERRWFGSEWGEWAATGVGSNPDGGLDYLRPVEADTHDESDGPDTYQSGFSVELTTSGWAGTGNSGDVLTYLDLSFPQGHQTFVDTDGAIYQRLYNSGTGGDWSEWERKDSDVVLEDDAFTEADEPDAYPADLTVFMALTVGNWPTVGNTPAIVRTARLPGSAEQLLTRVSSTATYRRTHDGNAWTDWQRQINQADLDLALGTINDSIANLEFNIGTINDSLTSLDGRVSALENP